MSQPELMIDLGALAANWRALNEMSPGAETAAVVKADAYGLGLAPVARKLRRAGADIFCVATPEEGAALREILGPAPVIYVFNGMQDGEDELFVEAALRPVLNSVGQIETASKMAGGLERRVQCALHIDTGMNRLGLPKAELMMLIGRPESTAGLNFTHIFSHLACADEDHSGVNERQRAVFAARAAIARRAAPSAGLSLAATGGVMLGPRFHYDLVRPGIGAYGGAPFAEAQPVVTLHAPILQIREVALGETVGYGATWRAGRATRIATIAAGYADGLHRALSNAGVAHLGEAALPFIGLVSMDLATLDVTDAPNAQPGDLVELIGPRQSIDDLAARANTIGYELLTSLGSRYARRYKDT